MNTRLLKNQIHALGLISLTTFTTLLISCTPSQLMTAVNESKDSGIASKYNMNAYPMTKLVCDPFGGGGQIPTPRNGLKAQLWYKAANQSRFYSAMDYINKTTKSEQTLFFSKVDVPTRIFDKGFPLESGGVVKTDAGDNLIEYFAMQFESNLKLQESDPEGNYELAILSDDGSLLKVNLPGISNQNTWLTLINNDGDTPTRMGCSSNVLNLKHDVAVPIQLSYYQGPRMHIANRLIWRKSDTAGKDAYCNQAGNTFFFDDQTSEPKAWKDLEKRGWKVIPTENFVLNENDYNACFPGSIAKINEFKLEEISLTFAQFSWTTDIPASSQVLIINNSTGEKRITDSDNVLRTSHRLTVSGLQPGTSYRVQALSISQNLGRAISEPIEIVTP